MWSFYDEAISAQQPLSCSVELVCFERARLAVVEARRCHAVPVDLLFGIRTNTKYHTFRYSHVFARLKNLFLASCGAWLEHEFILEDLNRQLFQKQGKLMAYAASCVLKQCKHTRKCNKIYV